MKENWVNAIAIWGSIVSIGPKLEMLDFGNQNERLLTLVVLCIVNIIICFFFFLICLFGDLLELIVLYIKFHKIVSPNILGFLVFWFSCEGNKFRKKLVFSS